MAKRSESANKTVEDLNKQTHDLKTCNHELTAQLNKVQHAKQSSKERYEAIL
jgi:chaperonin cofactor prefoldin